MRFGSPTVSVVRTAEVYPSGDFDSRPSRCVRAQDDAPVRILKSQVTYGLRTKNSCERSHDCMVFREAAASCAGVGPASGIEGIPCFAVVRKRISQHKRVSV